MNKVPRFFCVVCSWEPTVGNSCDMKYKILTLCMVVVTFWACKESTPDIGHYEYVQSNYVEKPFSIDDTTTVVFSGGNMYVNQKLDTCFFQHQYDYWASDYDLLLQDPVIRDTTTGKHSWGRLLTEKEWNYLLYQRPNAICLRGQAIVNTIHGYILLPDDWSLPIGLSFVCMTNNWTTNIYSATQWQLMESHGAVFFPCAGHREKGKTYYPEQFGYYWVADSASFIFIGSDFADVHHNAYKTVAMSVRPARRAP